MMKKLVSLLTILMFICICSVPVCSVSASQSGYVIDEAGILSLAERNKLEGKARNISEAYQCGVYIMTVDDYRYYDNDTMHNVAKAIYREYDMGYGREADGILLLLSMRSREYILLAYGYGNTAFTDYGKDWLSEQFLDEFRNDDWKGGFDEYLNCSSKLLELAGNGEPLDVGQASDAGFLGVVCSAVLALIVSAVIGSGLKSSMRSVARKCEASEYISDNGVTMTQRRDLFVKRTTKRTKIEKSSGSRRGGGTTTDRSGFSSKSGKF